MKAYIVWDSNAYEPYTTIVFADNANRAKAIAMYTDNCEDAEYIDIRVRRAPMIDYLYKGHSEIDYDDEETRIVLVKDLGWCCGDISFECDQCIARKYCSRFED